MDAVSLAVGRALLAGVSAAYSAPRDPVAICSTCGVGLDREDVDPCGDGVCSSAADLSSGGGSR